MNFIIRSFAVDNISSHQIWCTCLFFDQDFVNYFIAQELLLILMEKSEFQEEMVFGAL